MIHVPKGTTHIDLAIQKGSPAPKTYSVIRDNNIEEWPVVPLDKHSNSWTFYRAEKPDGP